MAIIEGFRVQNYRALRDVTLGRVSGGQGEALTPFTVVIGKNGVGKSSLFDAFGFVADGLATDVETACDMKQRGGFERLRSKGSEQPIRFEIYYREASNERPITYELSISLDERGRPFVESELLKQRRKGQKHGRPYPFLRLHHGKGLVWAGEEAVETEGEEDRTQAPVELTDTRQLGIATLGTLKEHPRIKRFRDFLKGWYLSYFHPDAARSLPMSGPQRHLNVHGDNIGNVGRIRTFVPDSNRTPDGAFLSMLKKGANHAEKIVVQHDGCGCQQGHRILCRRAGLPACDECSDGVRGSSLPV
ncbi:MAG: AAA family ATPase [Lautropia sp.]|nr:AAA family ATPase [Lautropia sp.]